MKISETRRLMRNAKNAGKPEPRSREDVIYVKTKLVHAMEEYRDSSNFSLDDRAIATDQIERVRRFFGLYSY